MSNSILKQIPRNPNKLFKMDRIDIFEQIRELKKSIDSLLEQDDISISNLIEISNRIDWFSQDMIKKISNEIDRRKTFL